MFIVRLFSFAENYTVFCSFSFKLCKHAIRYGCRLSDVNGVFLTLKQIGNQYMQRTKISAFSGFSSRTKMKAFLQDFELLRLIRKNNNFKGCLV